MNFLITPFIVISTGDIRLSAKLWEPREVSDRPAGPVLLFVHQYAKMGGSGALMEGMARNAANYGYTSVTFDLRGAGRSTGACTFTNYAEMDDVKAMINHIINSMNKDVFLVGSSGGSALAGALLDYSDRIHGCMLIGYTWGWLTWFVFGWANAALESSRKPKLFIVGDRDNFTAMSTYEQKIGALSGDFNEMRVIEGKDHFEIEQAVYDASMMDWLHAFIEKLKASLEDKKCGSSDVDM